MHEILNLDIELAAPLSCFSQEETGLMATLSVHNLQDCDLNVSVFLFARLVFLWAHVGTCGLYVDVPRERAVNVGMCMGSNKGGACENGKDFILRMHNTGKE